MASRLSLSSGGCVAAHRRHWHFTRSTCAGSLLLCFATSAQRLASQTKQDFLSANIDSTVSPRDDFFQFANGAWLKRNPIPEDQARWGIWNVVSEDLYTRLRRASEAAATKRRPRGSVEQLIGDFWFTGMDSVTINRQGLSVLRPDLDRIDRIRSIGGVMDIVAILHRRNMPIDGMGGTVGFHTLFSHRIAPDDINSTRRLFIVAQGGLSLNAPVYSATEARRVQIRSVFRDYLFKTFRRLGRDSAGARADADAVFDLEARIARTAGQREESRVMGLTELSQLTPAIDWTRYFRQIGVTAIDSVTVASPKFFQALDSTLRVTPLETWRDYLRFCLVRAHAPFLDDATFGEYFALDSALTGVLRPRPRWRRVIWEEKNWLGQPLAQLVAKEYFPADVQARYASVGETLREAFRNRILQLDWMGDSTKANAQRKLAALKITIGLPERWLDASTMPLGRDSYAMNMARSAEWFHDWEMRQLGLPVERPEIDPQYSVGGDAYYDNNTNEVQLPSLSGVPGWNNATLDDAFIYGSTALGHEISHAFDSNGRHYDAQGNEVDWWTAKDSVAFNERAQLLIDEYSEFIPLEGVEVNGRRSLAENMADLVGARIALDAFKKTDQYKRNEKVAGFTPLQRFFLAYAYAHMGQERPEYLRATAGGAYAPSRERANGVLMNIPEFYEAFGVRPGDRMYRPESARAKIW